MQRRRARLPPLRALAPAALLAAAAACAPAPARPPAAAHRPDVPFVRTHDRVVDRMLGVAGVTGGDVLYDLGCGDGRIVITVPLEDVALSGAALRFTVPRAEGALRFEGRVLGDALEGTVTTPGGPGGARPFTAARQPVAPR